MKTTSIPFGFVVLGISLGVSLFPRAFGETHNVCEKAHGEEGFLARSSPARHGLVQTLVFAPGESQVLKSRPFESTWLSKGSILSVVDQGQSLKLQARKPGEGFLRVGTRLYHIQVVSPSLKKGFLNIKNFLNTRQGLCAFLNPEGFVVVTGRLHRLKDLKDLHPLVKSGEVPWLLKARVSPALRPRVRSFIQEQTRPWLSPHQWRILWHSPLTALVPKDPPLSESASKALKSHGLHLIADPSLLSQPALIEFKLLLVEMRDNQSLKIHSPYGGEAGDRFITRVLDGSFFEKWLQEFQTLQSRGKGHILARAVILNQSGKTAKFLSGGEVPIPHFHPQTGQPALKWKPYGIRLKLKSLADRTGTIHTDLQAEISDVDHSFSSRQAPSLKTHRFHSRLSVKDGETLALTGLVRWQGGKGSSAPWPLFNLPGAGKWLAFKGKLKEQTRLNIFVTPRLIK